jgi:hypothetical protein
LFSPKSAILFHQPERRYGPGKVRCGVHTSTPGTSSELYRAGLTDFPAVLDAQRELYASEDLLAQSRTAQTVNLIALYKAVGCGWQSVTL